MIPHRHIHNSNEADDSDSDSSQSIDLLADTPSPKVKKKGAAVAKLDSNADDDALHNDSAASLSPNNDTTSPATLTLNQLSQSQLTMDLHYDMDNLDYDVAQQHQQHQRQSKQNQTSTTLRANDSDEDDDDNEAPPAALKSSNRSRAKSSGNNKKDTGKAAVVATNDKQTMPALSSERQTGARNVDRSKSKGAAAVACTTEATSTESVKNAAKAKAANAASAPMDSKQSASQGTTTSDGGLGNATYPRGVEQYDLSTGQAIAAFKSMRSAGRACGIDHRKIVDVVHGQRSEAGGFGWRDVVIDDNANGGSGVGNHVVAMTTTKSKKTTSSHKQVAPSRSSKRQRERGSKDVSQTNVSTTTSQGASKRPRHAGADINLQRNKALLLESETPSVPSSQVSVATTASKRNHRGNPVQQIDLSTGHVVATFSSLREAERQTQIDRKEIGRVVTGRLVDTGGYGWKFENDELSVAHQRVLKKEKVAARPKTPRTSKTKKPAPQPTAIKTRGSAKPSSSKTAPGKKGAPDKSNTAKSARSKTAKQPGRKAAPETSISNSHDVSETQSSELDELSIGDFRILRFEILASGKLGMDISARNAPPDLKDALDRQDENYEESGKCCMIDDVDADGLAQLVGLRPGDCFVQECKQIRGIVALSEYNDTRDALKSSTRPLVLFVARRKVVFDDFVSKALAELPKGAPVLFDSSGLDHAVERAGATNSNHVHPPTVAPTTSAPPFCRKCNDSSGRIPSHHAWCPKHVHFDISGAREIMEEIQEGMDVNCKTCLEEYQIGRTIRDGIHGLGCSRRPPDSKMPAQGKQTKQQKPAGKSSMKKKPVTKSSSKGRTIRPTSKVEDTLDLAAFATVDDSAVSDFEADLKAKSKPAPSKRGHVDKGAKASNKRKANPAKTGDSKRKKTGKVTKPMASEGRAKVTDEAAHQDKPRSSQQGQGQNSGRRRGEFGASCSHVGGDGDDEELSVHSDEELETSWESSENPWGSDYKDGDVVVFAPKLPIEEQESALLSMRFERDPFDAYPRYRTTHTTPDEGLHTLVLRREILGNCPWGFYVYRDDLGGACLVKDIVPMSPADAAVSVALYRFISDSPQSHSHVLCNRRWLGFHPVLSRLGAWQ